MPGKSTPINYKLLLRATLNDKFSYFMLGFTVFFIFLASSMLIVKRYVKLPTFNSPKKVIVKQAPKTKETLYYTVGEGDSLASISQKLYSTTDYASQIASLNAISNPNLIEPGMKLKLPQISPKPIENGQIGQAASTGQVTFKGDKYTVQEGDLLWDIAVKAYGDGNMWTKIASANNLSDPNDIHTGNILLIPRN